MCAATLLLSALKAMQIKHNRKKKTNEKSSIKEALISSLLSAAPVVPSCPAKMQHCISVFRGLEQNKTRGLLNPLGAPNSTHVPTEYVHSLPRNTTAPPTLEVRAWFLRTKEYNATSADHSTTQPQYRSSKKQRKEKESTVVSPSPTGMPHIAR